MTSRLGRFPFELCHDAAFAGPLHMFTGRSRSVGDATPRVGTRATQHDREIINKRTLWSGMRLSKKRTHAR